MQTLFQKFEGQQVSCQESKSYGVFPSSTLVLYQSNIYIVESIVSLQKHKATPQACNMLQKHLNNHYALLPFCKSVLL